MVKTYFLILVSAIWLLMLTPSLAQKPKRNFKKSGVVQLNDSLTSYSQSDIFIFPNVNKIKYYRDEEKLLLIKNLGPAGDFEQEYTETKAYVKNFGIENFSRDAQLLWNFARLSEKLGPSGEAVLLYKLVLKHLPQTIDGKQVKSEFDTLVKNQTDLYVPLADYYELVDYRKEIDTLRPPQGVLLNMGEAINSLKADYGATIGNVDNVLLFTSKRNSHSDPMNKSYNEDLFYSLKMDTLWGFAEELKNINTSYNEGSGCLSKDGKQLFFARCNSPDSYGNCDIFVADLLLRIAHNRDSWTPNQL